MTSSNENQSCGVPPPITELTVEQQFKIKQLELLLPEADKEEIITVFLALQRQAFVLGNNMMNLISHFPCSTGDHITSRQALNQLL